MGFGVLGFRVRVQGLLQFGAQGLGLRVLELSLESGLRNRSLVFLQVAISFSFLNFMAVLSLDFFLQRGCKTLPTLQCP